MKAHIGRIGADEAEFQFTMKKIPILDGMENDGFPT